MVSPNSTSSNSDDSVSSSDVFLLFDDSSDVEKREMGKNILDTHIREKIRANQFKYTVQQNLAYDLDPDQLVDDLMENIVEVETYSPDDSFGSVCVDLIASTVGHGRIEQVPGQPSHNTAPTFANSTFVKCSLKAFCTFSINGMYFDVGVSVSQHPMNRPDQ